LINQWHGLSKAGTSSCHPRNFGAKLNVQAHIRFFSLRAKGGELHGKTQIGLGEYVNAAQIADIFKKITQLNGEKK
jgi:hypothetical protein